MPKNKDLKRLVRARMAKTGESYTAARARILAKRPGDDALPEGPSPEELATLAGMSDDAVAAKTGHTWAEWVGALDAVDAATLPHGQIAAWVRENHDLSAWWAQTVTVGYERIRGLREIGQRRDGTFEASKSKTFSVPVERLYDAFAHARRRRRWLPGVEIEVRKCVRPKSVRWLWDDGTPVEAQFTDKGPQKSSVQIQHRQLPDRETADAAKADWAERLEALADELD